MSESKSSVIWTLESTDDIDHLWDYYADVAGHTAANKMLREIARVVATTIFPSRDDLATRCGQAFARSLLVPKSCSIA
jgi:plasmid stabilization system protein ParE